MIVDNVMSALQSATFETQSGSEYNTMLATMKQDELMGMLDTKILRQFEHAVCDEHAVCGEHARADWCNGRGFKQGWPKSSGLSNGLTEEAEEPPCDAFVGRKAPVRKWQRCCWCCTCMLRGVGARWIGTRGSELLRVTMMGQNERWTQLTAIYDVCKRLMDIYMVDIGQADESQEESQSSVGPCRCAS
jgi:hypothetical protein